MSLFSPDTCCLIPEAYYAMQLTQFAMAEQHSHQRCEIMFVLSGKCRVQVGHTEIRLTNGQYIFLDENVPHALEIREEKGCSILNIEFSCRKEGSFGSIRQARENSPAVRRFLSRPAAYFTAENRESFGAVIKDLIFQLERGAEADRFLIGNLLERGAARAGSSFRWPQGTRQCPVCPACCRLYPEKQRAAAPGGAGSRSRRHQPQLPPGSFPPGIRLRDHGLCQPCPHPERRISARQHPDAACGNCRRKPV